MGYIRKCTVLFIAIIIPMGFICANNNASATLEKTSIIVESDADRQLRIIKTALLNGPSQQNRLDAAVELLIQPDQKYRKTLLDTLSQKDNSPARQAICKALAGTRIPINEKMDFLEPLLAILNEKDSPDAKFAAEATLIFEYTQIASHLSKNVHTIENDRSVRLNGIYALRLRPVEKAAVSAIADLIDDPDKLIAKAARQAIPYWIPAGLTRQQIHNYLKNKSQREIIRDWAEFQAKELRRLASEKSKWQALYFSSLEKDFEEADDTSKGIIIQKSLASELSDIRLWGLDKVALIPPTVILPAEFNNLLLDLISDPFDSVRLKTAEVLSTMSDRNPAEKLLAQYNVEEDEEIKLQQFKAIGEACYFAFSPGSNIKLPESVRSETLALAEKNIMQLEPEIAIAGAEVIRKMLEPNGLEQTLIDKYLKIISDRYARAEETNPQLAAELLDVMAKVCGQSSHQDLSARYYLPYFNKALDNSNQYLRIAAVTGLINVDKTSALQKFLAQGLVTDPDESIRLAIIDLAGKTGTGKDIEWLIKRIPVNGDGPGAWNSIIQILQRLKAVEIYEWANKLIASENTTERIIQILELAQTKSQAEGNTIMLQSVNDILRPMQLETALSTFDSIKAATLTAEVLKEGDISDESPVAKIIDSYFNSTAEQSQKRTLLSELTIITKDANKVNTPKWQIMVDNWSAKISSKPDSDALPLPVQNTEFDSTSK